MIGVGESDMKIMLHFVVGLIMRSDLVYFQRFVRVLYFTVSDNTSKQHSLILLLRSFYS